MKSFRHAARSKCNKKAERRRIFLYKSLIFEKISKKPCIFSFYALKYKRCDMLRAGNCPKKFI